MGSKQNFFTITSVMAVALAVSFVIAGDKTISLKSISTALNEFSSNLLKEINEQYEGVENLVVSPLSAHVILSMTAYGAGGNTAQQMKGGLRLPSDDALGKKEFKYLSNYINDIENVTLEVSNSIYLSDEFRIKPEFKDLSMSYFLAEASELDFNDVDEAISIINQWTNEKTHNKIPEIVTEDNIGSDTEMILLNAVYFKGNWEDKFDKKLTSARPFHLAGEKKKHVPTMFKSGRFVWGELPEKRVKFVKIPYENKNLKMIVIVPDEIHGVEKIWQNIEYFNGKTLDKNSRSKQKIHLYLPKFKVQSEIDLNEPLFGLGMTDMFDYAANFTGISDQKVRIAKVLQKAVIEVNEEGSEAAAATVVDGNRMGFVNPVTIDVNRPFYYRIVDDSKDLILFEGIVRNPKY